MAGLDQNFMSATRRANVHCFQPCQPPPLHPLCSKAVEAQTALWHSAFLSELAAAKRTFEGLKAELPAGPALPPHSGRMLVLRGLIRSVERVWDHLQALAGGGCLPAVPTAAESTAAYEALHMGMQQYANTLHMEASRGCGWRTYLLREWMPSGQLVGKLACCLAGTHQLEQVPPRPSPPPICSGTAASPSTWAPTCSTTCCTRTGQQAACCTSTSPRTWRRRWRRATCLSGSETACRVPPRTCCRSDSACGPWWWACRLWQLPTMECWRTCRLRTAASAATASGEGVGGVGGGAALAHKPVELRVVSAAVLVKMLNFSSTGFSYAQHPAMHTCGPSVRAGSWTAACCPA